MGFKDATKGFSHKRPKRRWRRIFVPFLLALALVIALLISADYFMNYGKIYRGVSAGGVDLSGKTPEEARNMLEEQTGSLKEIKLTGPKNFTIPSEDVGVNFDVSATVDRAYAVGRHGDVLKRIYDGIQGTWGTISVPLVVSYDREQLRVGLSEVFKELISKPVEAGFEADDNGVTVTSSQNGQHVDEEKLLDDLEAGLPLGRSEYELPIVTDEPTLTTEEAEKLKPTTRLGKYRTDYTLSSDKSRERVENLAIGSSAINGTLLAPGEVFEMNKLVSPLHYNKTDVIINGKEDKADGGGLCQVTSTLYMAANYAGLNILERHPHATQLPYIRPGFDATVWFGNGSGNDGLDMKFENDTDSYILLREYVADDGYIYAEIWGRPTGKEVEMDSEPTYLGADYSKWVTYKKVTDKDGKVLYDDVFHKDTYQPYVDEKGKVFPPNSKEVTVAPVDP